MKNRGKTMKHDEKHCCFFIFHHFSFFPIIFHHVSLLCPYFSSLFIVFFHMFHYFSLFAVYVSSFFIVFSLLFIMFHCFFQCFHHFSLLFSLFFIIFHCFCFLFFHYFSLFFIAFQLSNVILWALIRLKNTKTDKIEYFRDPGVTWLQIIYLEAFHCVERLVCWFPRYVYIYILDRELACWLSSFVKRCFRSFTGIYWDFPPIP